MRLALYFGAQKAGSDKKALEFPINEGEIPSLQRFPLVMVLRDSGVLLSPSGRATYLEAHRQFNAGKRSEDSCHDGSIFGVVRLRFRLSQLCADTLDRWHHAGAEEGHRR